MKHINVALFVPDEGCPHRCSFCNQKTISGKSKKLTTKDIDIAVETALSSADCNDGEIAFFGGSFTAIERDYMLSLLACAKKYIDKGFFKGIRISTRPDCINEEILETLSFYGVTSIELGCQSMSDRVLLMNTRGHTSEDVIKSAELIKAKGFELGVQMMTGLYGDSDAECINTAKKLIALRPDTARIYPTVVLENTELCRLYRKGEYSPQSLESAVSLCSELLLMFHKAEIPVIRLGLHSGGNVDEGFVAGAYHPAFRELCEGEIYFEKILSELENQNIPGGDIDVSVGERYVSMAVGQKKCNIDKLNKLGFIPNFIKIKDYPKYKVSVRLTK